jgi:hypothetical protein
MQLVRLPSNPRHILDLSKVSLVECDGGAYAGPVVFSTSSGEQAELQVEVAVEWIVWLHVNGEILPWSGIAHSDEQDALAEMSVIADRISRGKGVQGGFEDG